MKNTFTRALLCLLLVFVGYVGVFAQSEPANLNHTWTTVRSTQGRDFFVTFMKNAGTEIDDTSLALQLRITTMAEEANGNI